MSTEDALQEIQSGLEMVTGALDKVRQSLVAQERASIELIRKNDLMNYDKGLVKAFIEKPYIIRQMRGHIHELLIPRFINFKAGWPVRTEGEYNVFQVSRFIDLMMELPEWLRKELNYTKPEFKAHFEGDHLVIDKGDPAKVWRDHGGGGKNFASRHGNKIKIVKSRQFDIMRNLIRSGVLPYIPRPIPAYLLTKPNGKIILRDEQMRDFEFFVQSGAVSAIAKGGAGKSYFGMYAIQSIKGKKIIFAPRTSILEQWKYRIGLLAPECLADVEFRTYQSLHKSPVKGQYALAIFDEIQHLPAEMGLKASQIDAIARIGLTATPWREDGNEDIIPALCGYPVGFDWPTSGSSDASVWIVKDDTERMQLLKSLMAKPTKGKTMIFVYRLEVGKRIASMLNIPFIHGATRNQYKMIEESNAFVISMVGDAGISINATKVIEVDFLGGRVQLGQRALRTNHATDHSEFHMITTKADYKRFSYRLAALTSLDFDVKVFGNN